MKYMGNKGRILPQITGVIGNLLSPRKRFVDLFSGSGIVSWSLSTQFRNEVWANDLQSFARSRAAAVLERLEPPKKKHLSDWIGRAEEAIGRGLLKYPELDISVDELRTVSSATQFVRLQREIAPLVAKEMNHLRPVITNAYGGYYFSVQQALMIDALRSRLPRSTAARAVAMGALIGAVSRCAASPGHTAQPFQPTKTATKWLLDAWRRNPRTYIEGEWQLVESYEAKVPGKALVGDANRLITQLDAADVAFIDPPYSGVHYSRFYHVLETLNRGRMVEVGGRGRYPPPEERPVSAFSKRAQSIAAMYQLLGEASKRGLRIVVTFPISPQSNGLSADVIGSQARHFFRSVHISEVTSNFSTLGGNGSIREARKIQKEAVIAAYN